MSRAQFRAIGRLSDAVSAFDGSLAAQALYEIAAMWGAQGRQRRISVIVELLRCGSIDREQFRAASEIESVYAAITAACGGRTACYAPERGDPMADASPVLSEAYLKRYMPWRDVVGKRPVIGSATVGDLVILAVVDNLGMYQLADRYRIGRPRALGIVQSGLAEYVRIAGW